MKKTNKEAEIARLKRELSDANKQIKKLSKNSDKLQEKSKEKIANLQKEIKKKDVLRIILTKEQEQLLSNLSKDINILKLLSD
ncbi:MAG: hypothetical protein GXZ03_05795 [Proteiniphilum sp.]|nr:hypothetical protein [Proteiniphilum sp.]